MTPLAEVRVPPPNVILAVLVAAQRRRNQEIVEAIEKAAGPANEFAEFMNRRWREGDERESQMLAMTLSVTDMTKRLLVLQVVTVVIAVLSLTAAILALALT